MKTEKDTGQCSGQRRFLVSWLQAEGGGFPCRRMTNREQQDGDIFGATAAHLSAAIAEFG
jgi:hypothetical protein